MSAIAATFCAFRTVAGRKQLQLVFEAPVEQTEHILKLLGYPDPGGSRWVGIAPLELGKKTETQAERATARKPESKRWQDMKLSARAGIMCADKGFWKYVEGQMPNLKCDSEKCAADYVRWRCQVPSRADLDKSAEAGNQFLELEAEFNRWAGRRLA